MAKTGVEEHDEAPFTSLLLIAGSLKMGRHMLR